MACRSLTPGTASPSSPLRSAGAADAGLSGLLGSSSPRCAGGTRLDVARTTALGRSASIVAGVRTPTARLARAAGQLLDQGWDAYLGLHPQEIVHVRRQLGQRLAGVVDGAVVVGRRHGAARAL